MFKGLISSGGRIFLGTIGRLKKKEEIKERVLYENLSKGLFNIIGG